MAVKNVFADPDPTWLCPVNPDVREYLAGLVADLSANYPISTIELESPTFPPQLHRHSHYKLGVTMGPIGEFLMQLCFCESCRQRALEAQVDVDMAARSVRTHLERLLQGGGAGGPARAQPGRHVSSLTEFVQRDPAIEAYLRWRQAELTRVVGMLRSACACRLIVYVLGDELQAGADWAQIGRGVDGLLCQCFDTAEDTVERAVDRFAEAAGGVDRLAIGLYAAPPASPDSATLVRRMTRAAELGVRTVNIYNYGIVPEANLEWVRQAIRSARRAAQ